jgi:hypothetical protein
VDVGRAPDAALDRTHLERVAPSRATFPPSYVFGLLHGSNAPPSSRHSNESESSGALKTNVTAFPLDEACGSSIVTSGGITTAKGYVTTVRLPVARTSST